jgi:aminopeptidase
MERAARNELSCCYTEFPTQASAQEADPSLSDDVNFVYGAGLLDLSDPVNQRACLHPGGRQI